MPYSTRQRKRELEGHHEHTSKAMETNDTITPGHGTVTPDQNKQMRVTEEPSIHGSQCSGRSKSSASTIARRKQLELKAAEEKAKIQMELIEKRLEAQLAIADAEEEAEVDDVVSRRSKEVLHECVEDWLDHRCVTPAPCSTDNPRDGIQQLVHTLKDILSNQSSHQEQRLLSRLATPRELPTFSGDCIEWLHFKKAYEESTSVCKFSDSENLWRLRKALQGDAKDAVTDLLIGNTPPSTEMMLELRFGRPDLIIHNLTNILRKLAPLSTSYQADIVNFSVKISNCVATIRALNQDDYLRSPELSQAIISKLPSTLVGKWTDYAFEKIAEGKSKLELLAAFLMRESKMVSLVGVTHETKKCHEMSSKRTETYHRHRTVCTTVSTEQINCKFCNKHKHQLTDCREFKRAMRKDKWRFVKIQRLCFRCLIARHDSKMCTAPLCDIDQCGLMHHRLLHWKKYTAEPVDESSPQSTQAAVTTSEATVAHVTNQRYGVMLKVVEVQLTGPKGTVTTYALLDDAASVSIIDSALADSLGLQGENSSAVKFIDAFGLEVYQSEAPCVRAKICGNDSIKYDIKMHKVSKLNLPQQNLSIVNGITCDHLLSIKDKVCYKCVVPRLLIGEDNYFLIAPLEIRHGDRSSPYATRCRLGWCIHGCCGRAHSQVSEHIFHLASLDTNNSDDSMDTLNRLIQNYFSIDSVGICSKSRENASHVRAIQILDDTARQIGEQWEVGLPFIKDNFTMPETYNYALHRQHLLLRKFNMDKAYAERYKNEINRLFIDGYARELSESELSSKPEHVWYLPHFGVLNPNKPNKLRLVFDAAGKVHNVCLNDYLITGPDLYNSLFGIMFRFRENKVAIMGDIKDMFLRIRIRPEDQHVLRFLWQENADSPIKICVMISLIFGATCSPFIAQYIKNKNALKYEDEYPEAVHVIVHNHYMDDCLHSTSDATNAIKLVNDINAIYKNGGFCMRGWLSNDKSVLDKIPANLLANTAVQFKDGAMNTVERTLGLMWHPAFDTFAFNICLNRIPENILSGIEYPTKSKMLSIIMSVYDIQGFLCPFTIKAKILLQQVHRSGVDWKCRIHAEEHSKWVRWLNELKQIQTLRIPRWYSGEEYWIQCYENSDLHILSENMNIIIDVQLHVFCDASIHAYATVLYWRFTRTDGSVKVCFVTGKSRVAPLRPLSVPRLELQGALIGARMADMVQREHKTLKPHKRYFWVDSSTVLQWIRSDPRSYKAYVAQRLGEIDELTTVAEWRYVPSALNVADLATKEDTELISYEDVWFQGPQFLRMPEDKWPKDLKNVKSSDDVTVEKLHVNLVTVGKTCSLASSLPNEDRFSSWNRFLRSTGRVLQFIKRCRLEKSILDVSILIDAEDLILRKCQHDSFAAEIQCLKENKPLMTNSRLLTLTPYLDDKQLLRVGGRVDKAVGVRQSMMRPVILDGKHKITRLIVEFYHRRALHGAHETVVNELRQRYWILQLRPTVRSIGARCLFCRYRRAMPRPQRMADLPASRLQHNRRPFSCTGVDFFGPMEVTVGRGRQKRYGVLFTCLTVRAIHIELTESLSTDSTIMAIRRMSTRRGTPSIVYSDNGTNLRGADAELKQSLRELNEEKIQESASVRGIEWRFIPPGAPEMGGAWERMIRTVKTALKVVLREQAPHQETLTTLLIEIEGLVNSRPITHVSSDPDFPEALTPNHFLIGSSSNQCSFGKYDDVDLSLRKKWRVAQRLTDMFWQRWLKEYLPTLLPRQKWNRDERGLREGDYVLLVEPNLERGSWRHGVVSAAYTGDDGRVRMVDVRTRTGILRRPVTRVALLDPTDSLC